MQRIILCATALSTLFATGCAHVPLARNTGKQVQTIADIQEQQVLDNIAMFVANPGATPFFAQPTAGSTQVIQGGSGGIGLSWNPTTLMGETLNLNGNTSLSENWTLQPINNPDRLVLMKCLYRHVTRQIRNDPCLDCYGKLQAFFGAEFVCCDAPDCWFGYGTKKQIPSCCRKVGHYCGTYVWVTPENFDQLSRVTMSILDIATADLTSFAPRTVAVEETFAVGNATVTGTYRMNAEAYEELRKKIAPPALLESTKKDGRLESYSEQPFLPLMSPDPLFRPRIETGGGLESLLLLPRAH